MRSLGESKRNRDREFSEESSTFLKFWAKLQQILFLDGFKYKILHAFDSRMLVYYHMEESNFNNVMAFKDKSTYE